MLFRSLGYLSYSPTIEEIREGKVAHLHVNASSAVGRPRHQRNQLPPEEALVWWLMSRSDHRGSDVRLTTGEIMKPSRISRQGVDSTWWNWKSQLTVHWEDTECHINEKECRAALTELRRRARSRCNHGSRYLHLVDSMVGIAVLCRRRSSSHKLNGVVRKMASLELASQIQPVYVLVRSSLSPADHPSRVRKKIPK